MQEKKYFISLGVVSLLLAGLSLFVLAATIVQTNPRDMILQVGPTGGVLIRGTIDTIGSDSFTMKSWGGIWRAKVSSETKFAPQGGLGEFKVGDFVGVNGSVDENAQWTVNARFVRDWSLIMPVLPNAPVIHEISGPTTLRVGETGVWTVNASDPKNGTLSYLVVWGDETEFSPTNPNFPKGNTFTQTATFSHAYSLARNYHIIFYVKNDAGVMASASTTVNVVLSGSQELPHINALQPSSGFVGSEVTVTGSGFTATDNRLKFGDLNTENDPNYNLSSSDGKTLFFRVPSTTYIACLHKTPPCLIQVANMMTQPGNYQVSVINANGTSNEVQFTVLGQGSQP